MTTQDEVSLESIANAARTKSFLGKEFLTWFWYQAEKTDQNQLELETRSGNLSLQIWVDDRLVLESHNSKVHMQTLRGGEPSQSLEAAASLQSGNSVKELRVGFYIRDFGEFTFALAGQNLDPRSIKLPEPPEELAATDGFSSLSYRLKLTRIMLDALDALFQKFLHERTETQWNAKGLADIKGWIANRYHQANELLH